MNRPNLIWAASVLFSLAIPATAQVGANQGLLNPNLASEEELAAVDGLDGDAVAAIVEGRPFLRAADLHAVISAHIAEDGYDGIYGAIWVPIDLNDATSDEIGLIPGVGRRMTHEFEEYRPYTALAQFHREIGKYVDDDEVARLAQYVYVRIDLNDASGEDILSNPRCRPAHDGTSSRSTGPTSALAQFRREIGKYVDDDEVERLARYVEIR